VLGYNFDCAKFESDLDKLKRTLNLECNPHPLYDPEDSDLDRRTLAEKHKREHIKMNQRINYQLLKEYSQILDMRISRELNELNASESKEEISLLGAIGGQFFQGIPTYTYM
jgi:hypothetical protein